MNSRTMILVIITLVGMAALATVEQADAALVTGTNTVLDAHSGNLYIPLKLSTSGTLGAPLGGGNFVGLNADTITLSSVNPSNSGNVSFTLTYDLNGVMTPSDIVSPAPTPTLVISVDDFDFNPFVFGAGSRTVTYRESMQLIFLANASDAPSGSGLTVDNLNYMTYRTSPAGTATNDVNATYEVPLTALGVLDYSAINADREFGVFVKLTSFTTSTGSGCVDLTNTVEAFGADFAFTSAFLPEPATMALLGIGATVMAARKRWKKA